MKIWTEDGMREAKAPGIELTDSSLVHAEVMVTTEDIKREAEDLEKLEERSSKMKKAVQAGMEQRGRTSAELMAADEDKAVIKRIKEEVLWAKENEAKEDMDDIKKKILAVNKFEEESRQGEKAKPVHMGILREALASDAHKVWSSWEEYRAGVLSLDNLQMWNRKAKTPFTGLTNEEKRSDFVLADEILAILREHGLIK